MEECGDVGVDIGDGGGGGDGIVRSKEVFKVGGGGVDKIFFELEWGDGLLIDGQHVGESAEVENKFVGGIRGRADEGCRQLVDDGTDEVLSIC